MELNKNDAVVCPDSIDVQASTAKRAEIDLYDELIAFTELSPEGQQRLGERPDKTSAETGETPEIAENPLREPVLTHVQIEPEEPETVAGESSRPPTDGAEEPPEPILIAAQIEPDESCVDVQIQISSANEDASPGFVVTHSPNEPIDSVTIVPAAEPASDLQVSQASAETNDDVRMPLFAGPRQSGPLSGFNLPPEIVYTGALSRGVCLACGAESGADDLFCLICGAFIDEIASALPSNSTCGECKQPIEVDEIFCPLCGSAIPA